MSLRLRLNLLVASLVAAFLLATAALLVDDAHRSIREEIASGTKITVQLLSAVVYASTFYPTVGTQREFVLSFLRSLGRVRAHDIVLTDALGHVVYRSPPSVYKAGREAPAWFARLVLPHTEPVALPLPGGTLTVTPDASRAVVDAWDDLKNLAAIALLLLAVAVPLVIALVTRSLRPLDRLSAALADLERGKLETRLARMPSPEFAAIGERFNRMAEALEQRTAENRRLALVAQQSSDAIVIEGADGRIDWCNPAAVRMFGAAEAKRSGERGEDLVGAKADDRRREGGPGGETSDERREDLGSGETCRQRREDFPESRASGERSEGVATLQARGERREDLAGKETSDAWREDLVHMDIVGRRLEDLDGVGAIAAALARAGGETVENVECTCATPDGRAIEVAVSAAPLVDAQHGERLGRILSLRDVTEHRRAVEAERALDESRRLTQIIQKHIEDERRNLARELHDELGQSVTAIKSIGTSIANRTRDTVPEIHASSRMIVDVAARLYDAMHDIVRQLRPSALDHLGLRGAVEGAIQAAQRQHPKVAITLTTAGELDGLGEAINIGVYRIVQECLTNALRHSEATRIDVALRRTDAVDGARLEVEVRDNGRGLAPASESAPPRFGILGVQERVQALGGTFAINAAPAGPGVRATANIPLAAVAHATEVRA